MSAKDTSEWSSFLETRKRLGVRYLSSNSSAAAPETSRQAVEPVIPAATSLEKTTHNISEKAAIYAPSKPQWLTASQESLQGMELTAFDKDICECQKCPLGAIRKRFVFGSGNPRAEVLFVGEAPGADEDEQGLPFVGKAGQLLTKIVESTQTWKRSDVFICNVLKCRPPGNRTPSPEEVDQCRPYLEEQIRVIKPRLIMALGAVAAQAILRTKDSVGKLRNRWHDHEGIPLRVTYHPAALLRFEGYKKDVWQDMKELTIKYKQLTQSS